MTVVASDRTGATDLALQSRGMRLLGDRGDTRHVLVRRVGARTDKSNLEILGPAILLNSLLELRKRCSQVGGERTVDMGLELGKVLR